MTLLADFKIPDEADLINGAQDLATIRNSEFMAVKADWERAGIKKGFLPDTTQTDIIDEEENTFPAFMTAHGKIYSQDDEQVNNIIRAIKAVPPDMIAEFQKMIYDNLSSVVDMQVIMNSEQEETTFYGSLGLQLLAITIINRALESTALIEKNLSRINNMVIRSLDDVTLAEQECKTWLTLYRWTCGSDEVLPPQFIRKEIVGLIAGETKDKKFPTEIARIKYAHAVQMLDMEHKAGRLTKPEQIFNQLKQLYATNYQEPQEELDVYSPESKPAAFAAMPRDKKKAQFENYNPNQNRNKVQRTDNDRKGNKPEKQFSMTLDERLQAGEKKVDDLLSAVQSLTTQSKGWLDRMSKMEQLLHAAQAKDKAPKDLAAFAGTTEPPSKLNGQQFWASTSAAFLAQVSTEQEEEEQLPPSSTKAPPSADNKRSARKQRIIARGDQAAEAKDNYDSLYAPTINTPSSASRYLLRPRPVENGGI